MEEKSPVDELLKVSKHAFANLKPDGSNLETCAFKHSSWAKACGCLHAFNVQPSTEEGKQVTANAIEDRQHSRFTAQLKNNTELDEDYGIPKCTPVEPRRNERKAETKTRAEKTHKLRSKLHSTIVCTLPEKLLHSLMGCPSDPAMAMAMTFEHFKPVDQHTKHQPFNTLANIDINKCNNDLSRMVAAVRDAGTRLASMGTKMDDAHLVSRLLSGLIPHHKCSLMKATIKAKGDVAFDEAASMINAHMRDKEQAKSLANPLLAQVNSLKHDIAKMRKKGAHGNYKKKKKEWEEKEQADERSKCNKHRKRKSGKEFPCCTCGKPGHMAKFCRKNKKRHKMNQLKQMNDKFDKLIDRMEKQESEMKLMLGTRDIMDASNGENNNMLIAEPLLPISPENPPTEEPSATNESKDTVNNKATTSDEDKIINIGDTNILRVVIADDDSISDAVNDQSSDQSACEEKMEMDAPAQNSSNNDNDGDARKDNGTDDEGARDDEVTFKITNKTNVTIPQIDEDEDSDNSVTFVVTNESKSFQNHQLHMLGHQNTVAQEKSFAHENEAYNIMLDSGCTKPMFSNPHCFTTFTPGHCKISLGAKESFLHSPGRGTVAIRVPNRKGSTQTMSFEALCVPKSPCNYMPPQFWEDSNHVVTVKKGIMSFTRNGREVACGKRIGNLRYLVHDFSAIENRANKRANACNALKHSRNEIIRIHARFGHASSKTMLDTAKHVHGVKLPAMPKRIDCPTCDMTNTRRPCIRKNLSDDEKRENPSRAHADSKTCSSKSMRGNTGFTMMVHEGSRHFTVVPHPNLKNTTKEIQACMNMVNNGSHVKIVELRADGGGEFTSHELQKWLKEKGMKFTPRTPCTPEQNAMAERGIQTTMKMVRSMLKHAGLSHGYWDWAAETSAYLVNRMTCSGMKNKTPHEAFTGNEPNLNDLVTWGCIGVAPTSEDERPAGGLCDGGMHVRMLGCDPRHGACLVMTKNRKLLRRKVEKWCENVFKFPTMPVAREMQTSPMKGNSPVPVSANVPTRTRSLENKAMTAPTQRGPKKPRVQNQTTPRRSQRTIPIKSTPETMPFNDLQKQIAECKRLAKNKNLLGVLLTEDDKISNDDSLHMAAHASFSSIENAPKTFQEATSGPERAHWMKGVIKELTGACRLKTFAIVPTPKAQLAKHRWVFRKKVAANGEITCKCRIVACGCSQRKGVDWFESCAPVMSLTSFRTLMALGASEGCGMHNIDINNACLNSQMDCLLCMTLPKGLECVTHLIQPKQRESLSSGKPCCVRLDKSLCGCAQSGFLWAKMLFNHLETLSFARLQTDPCVLVKQLQSRKLILGVYTDDIIILYKVKADLQWFLRSTAAKFEFKNLGRITHMLGMDIKDKPNGERWITQENYIMRMANKCNIAPSAKVATPTNEVPDLFLCENDQKVNPTDYRAAIGAALHVACATRPDMAFAVSTLARFSQDPRKMHMKAVRRLMQCMLNTSSFRLSHSSTNTMTRTIAHCDASYNSCPITSKSYTGFLVLVGGSPVTWKTMKQTIVADSTACAEHMALSDTCKETMHIRQFLEELGCKEKSPTPVHCDNSSAMSTSTKPGFTQKSKATRTKHHNTRQCVKDKIVEIRKMDGKANIADILTKGTDKATTKTHTSTLFTTPNDSCEEHLGMMRHEEKGSNGGESEANSTSHLHLSVPECVESEKSLKTQLLDWIAIGGNIGAGKSTIIKMMQDDSSITPSAFPENIETWNHDGILQKFYADQKSYASTMQHRILSSFMEFTTERMHLTTTSERCHMDALHMFAHLQHEKGHINEKLLKQWASMCHQFIPRTHIYIKTTPGVCLDRIKSRSRKGEENTPSSHLKRIAERNEPLLTVLKSLGSTMHTVDGNKAMRDVHLQIHRIMFNMNVERDIIAFDRIAIMPHDHERQWQEIIQHDDKMGQELTLAESGLPLAMTSLLENLNNGEQKRREILAKQLEEGQISKEKHMSRCIRVRRREERLMRKLNNATHHYYDFEAKLHPITDSDASDSDDPFDMSKLW